MTRTIRSSRTLLGLLALAASPFVATPFAVRPLAAQQKDPGQVAYEKRRADLLKQVDETNRQLSELRTQRVQMSAQLENVVAQQMQARARQLLMSDQQNALQQLDSLMVTAQDNLLSQRDRFRSLSAALRQRTGAVLVVLLRADSSQSQQLGAAELTVDNASAATRAYTSTLNSALQLGAVDQLYRSDVLPTTHTVRLQVTVNGQPLTQSVDVSAPGETVTYVQFAVRNGQLVQTTWTSRGTTPF